MQTTNNIDDPSIALIAAVARCKKGSTNGSLCESEEGGRLFGQASGGVIGFNGSIPWHLPADFAHFRKLTIDKTIIMGRCTYESIGRRLDRRTNIVVSSRPGYRAEGCTVVSSFDDALEEATSQQSRANPDMTKAVKDDDRPDILVIGGESIYRQALSLEQSIRLYLTLVDIDISIKISGDTFFPIFNSNKWHQNDYRKHEADDRNPHDMHFFDLIGRGESLA